MRAIELDMSIGCDGTIHLPAEHRQLYGQKARLVILLPDAPQATGKEMDPMDFSSTLDWPMDA